MPWLAVIVAIFAGFTLGIGVAGPLWWGLVAGVAFSVASVRLARHRLTPIPAMAWALFGVAFGFVVCLVMLATLSAIVPEGD